MNIDPLINQYEKEIDRLKTLAAKPLIGRAKKLFRYLRERYVFNVVMGMGDYNIQSDHQIPVIYDDDSKGTMTLHELQYWFAEEGGSYCYRPDMNEADIEKFTELCMVLDYLSSSVHYYMDLA